MTSLGDDEDDKDDGESLLDVDPLSPSLTEFLREILISVLSGIVHDGFVTSLLEVDLDPAPCTDRSSGESWSMSSPSDSH